MSRLIIFGCSLAYGVGLADCWPTSAKPSKLSWPQLVADEMRRQLINTAVPGASNKRIWYAISKFKFRPDDIVIISWSYPNRYSIVSSPWKIRDLHHNLSDTDPASDAYFKDVYSVYDSYITSKLLIDHANRLLLEKNVITHNIIVEKHFKHLMGKHKTLPLYMGVYEEIYPRALDGDHLGKEGHTAFAMDLLNTLGIKHTIVSNTKPYSIFRQLKNLICR
jgi:hypothetical protein